MEMIQFNVGITLEPQAKAAVVELLTQALMAIQSVDEARERRLRASQNALFAGEKPPDDKGLLITSREAAKLLKISERTLWKMWNEGEMPKPIHVGKAVRFSYDELRAWVNASGPPQNEWKWPKQDG